MYFGNPTIVEFERRNKKYVNKKVIIISICMLMLKNGLWDVSFSYRSAC